MTENPYGIPEPERPQPATPENPYGLPEGTMSAERVNRDPYYQPEPHIVIRRPETKPVLLGTASEDIKAGQVVVIDFTTGTIRPRSGDE